MVEWVEYSKLPKISSPDVEVLEGEYGVRLPTFYKTLVVANVGKIPVPSGMPLEPGGVPFGPLLTPSKDASIPSYKRIDGVIEELREWRSEGPRAPLSLFPIASDSSHGFFCFDYSVRSENPPIVLAELTQEPDDGVFDIADSLEDALAMLRD